MKKCISYIMVIVWITSVCTGCEYVRNFVNTSSVYSDSQAQSSSSDSTVYSSEETKFANTTNPITTTSRTVQTATNVVYDIYGVSNKLSAASVDTMQKWRDKVKAFGEKYPAVVFLNDQPQCNTVYLTFDDGPDRVITPQVVDILAENNVCGNFFFIGNQLEKYADVVKKAYDNKNFVGSHCFSHTKLTTMTSEQVKKEITDTNAILKGITGVAPTFIRPPYGDINDTVISEFKELDLKIVLWSIDTLDWSQRDASHIEKNITDHIRPGDIILMHCNSDKTETAKALPKIIQAIKDKGYKMGTFDQFAQ